jgi:hypothetical protein
MHRARLVVLVFVAALCAALSLAVPAGAAKPSRGQYLGIQGLETLRSVEDLFVNAREASLVTFSIARRDRFTLRNLVVTISSRCVNGRFYSGVFFAKRVAVAKDGSFSATLPENLAGHAFTRQGQLALTGKFKRSGKAANLQGRHTATGNDGTTCDSGTRAVTARKFAP